MKSLIGVSIEIEHIAQTIYLLKVAVEDGGGDHDKTIARMLLRAHIDLLRESEKIGLIHKELVYKDFYKED